MVDTLGDNPEVWSGMHGHPGGLGWGARSSWVNLYPRRFGVLDRLGERSRVYSSSGALPRGARGRRSSPSVGKLPVVAVTDCTAR